MTKHSHFRFSFIIPSLITLAATCSALTGIRFAINQHWQMATVCIILAAIFDALDGRAARMLKATSAFGEILDSLSDFVAFGVAPAFIVYFWVLHTFKGLGWAVSLFFVVCCGLRLARFNTMLDTKSTYSHIFFYGVPAPAGGLLGLLPIIVSFNNIHIPAGIVFFWTICIAILMISLVPMFSFKKIKLPKTMILPLMVVFGLAVAGIAGKPWFTLTVGLLGYLCSIPFSYSMYRSLKRSDK